ncbi:MAG TPA: M3 family metallopeptidase [Verrucomicrobiae bacterium]|nr:M3 family metallopeptidase [Verrucomicrobiae bacterium]
MLKKLVLLFALVAMAVSCSLTSKSPQTPASPRSLAEIQKSGAKFKNVLRLPEFETTPEAVKVTADQTMFIANAALDAIGRLNASHVRFSNTVGALDDIGFQISTAMNRLYLIKETSTNAAVREAATEVVKRLQEWAVGLDYREDVYRAVKAYADSNPKLTGEDARLLEETMRDYRRAGLALPKAQRDEVERLRKELSNVSTDFDSNVNKARKSLKFKRAELAGAPDSLLTAPGVKTAEDEYTIHVNVTWQYLAVLEHVKSEAVRKQVATERDRLAPENAPLVEKLLALRYQIATRLGYTNWADYQLEVKMAKNGATALEFERKLRDGLQPKFDAEVAAFRKLKAEETGDANARIHIWDWRYYAEQLKKTKYNVDSEQLRDFFPMQPVLDGMFAIYQSIFGVKFERLDPPYKWVDDLQLWAVSDARSGEPLGFFYLDLYPRDGKYNHFAVFSIIDGKRLADGRYQRPVLSLVCNFTPATADKPSLLDHESVVTLFHEFGHAMHGILTRAKYVRFSGSNVPGDFVEAPSQMLEYWVWDKSVLDSFAADYRDPSKKIPPEILSQLKAAKYATYGCHYRRQLSFGLMDLNLHTQITDRNTTEALPLANKTLGETFFPPPEGTAMITYFGHFTGYDAGYYGYAWADAIAADMATVFEQSRKGFFDRSTGMKLRKEIYSVGDSRDVNISIEKFLGRPRSIEPFLKQIGAKAEK